MLFQIKGSWVIRILTKGSFINYLMEESISSQKGFLLCIKGGTLRYLKIISPVTSSTSLHIIYVYTPNVD